jgi:hypothetical protein
MWCKRSCLIAKIPTRKRASFYLFKMNHRLKRIWQIKKISSLESLEKYAGRMYCSQHICIQSYSHMIITVFSRSLARFFINLLTRICNCFWNCNASKAAREDSDTRLSGSSKKTWSFQQVDWNLRNAMSKRI